MTADRVIVVFGVLTLISSVYVLSVVPEFLVRFSLWLLTHTIYRIKNRGKAQKLQIIKARQLGCSTLIEGLIAWRSMYFPNTNAMVVSHVPRHASYLFGIMLHIYDQLPWWMKPMISSRKEELGPQYLLLRGRDRRCCECQAALPDTPRSLAQR